MSDIDKLLPCPFCGSFNVFTRKTEGTPRGPYPQAFVNCGDCKASVLASTEKAANNKWNTRTNDWVSVDDRLPGCSDIYKSGDQLSDSVLVITEGNSMYVAWLSDVGREEGDIVWVSDVEISEVTHWMPLPDKPIESPHEVDE